MGRMPGEMTTSTFTARRFDWGVSSNIGIETHHWYAKLQYDLSLGKEGKNDVIGANYHTLTLSVGYKFGL